VKTTRVNKAELIEKLTENRGEHRALYDKAIEGYRKAALAELNSLVDAVKAGKTPRLYVSLPVPTDHTDDYDLALEMLVWSTDATVEVDMQSFRSYVLDDWGWKSDFLSTSSSYVMDSV
jgi:hypothetical protein